MRIVLHTLAAHVHTCDRFSRFSGLPGPSGYGGLGGGVPARSRDLSQLSSASIGETEKGEDDYEDDDEDEEDEEGGGAALRASGADSAADIQGWSERQAPGCVIPLTGFF